MTNEIIIAIVSAVAGGFVTLLTTLALDWRKEKRFKRVQKCKLLILRTIYPERGMA